MAAINVTAPFDGSEIGKVQNSNADDIERALAKAHALFQNRDGWIPLPERLDILRRTAEIIKERREELALRPRAFRPRRRKTLGRFIG